ncbi:MerR family transcriptional regulator [Streptomyces sp. SID11385]|uniref:MerR family transcriptional regulator n=1 Tax=Streptomyces sp. SID11385 TaxID=2706031 RepID=UPI0013C7A541|nr:MerR family transcriptional regulator [Streptomyces sp. SID11385]NEA41344.1 MerR family transcriptional regulator [Streptomyces sp. SID11385]
MRIGELAAVAGVSTRTVRHYHRIGLLPEPARRPNGYREYGLRDAVELARVRRLTELGLSLDEVRDVLADDAGKDLVEILAELDADLARQEESIRRRRARLRDLLAQAEADGGLPPEAPVSPALAALFADFDRAAAHLAGPEPASLALDRRLLALLDTSASAAGDWLGPLAGAFTADPEATRRAYALYARLDELASAAPDDPRVEETADELVALLPADLPLAPGDPADNAFLDALYADFAPAQAAVLRRVISLLKERKP